MTADASLRAQLIRLLEADDAHMRFEEAVADHNAYHVGEFAILRQVMGTWPQRGRS
jgi:hypothetical protein